MILRPPSNKYRLPFLKEKFFLFVLFEFPWYLILLHYCSMILQRIGIVVVDDGFEPGTDVSVVGQATNEPPHNRSNILLVEQFYKLVPIGRG